MSTYNNWGTAEEWRRMKSILEIGRPNSKTTVIDTNEGNLRKLNSMHGGFMDKLTPSLEEAERMISEANRKYDSLTSAVENTIGIVERCEEGGNVDFDDSYTRDNTNPDFVSPTSSIASNNLRKTRCFKNRKCSNI